MMSEFDLSVIEVSKLSEWNDFANLRKGRFLIGKLFHILQLASEHLKLNRFDQYSESELTEGAEISGGRLDQLGGKALLDGDSTPESRFDQTVFILRFLDQTMKDTPFIHNALSLKDMEFDNFYVVPCARQLDGSPQKRGQGFGRRGLRYHRIVPKCVGGLQVQIVLHPDVSADPSYAPRSFGASLFPGLYLDCKKPTRRSFLAANVTCSPPGHKEMVQRQLNAAISSGCNTLVWPELTIPSNVVRQISEYLAEHHLRRGSPPIVVAGSWHIPDATENYNRCTILDGRGDLLFEQDKALPFFDRVEDGEVEAICTSRTIKLLLTENELIGVLICLDFCHISRCELLDALDLSTAIVPSMGGATTVREHGRQAATLHTRRGTRTVVVQQAYSDRAQETTIAGYILTNPTGNIEQLGSSGATEEQFTSFRLDRAGLDVC